MIVVKKSNAFTLVELMVIILISTILLAAFAPVMTKRMTSNIEHPWRYSRDNKSVFFGTADNHKVMIGTKEPQGKFTINAITPDVNSEQHLSLAYDGTAFAHFIPMNSTNYFFTLRNGIVVSSDSPDRNTAFGYLASQVEIGENNSTLGAYAASPITGLDNTVVIGYSSVGGGNNDVVVGSDAGHSMVSGENNVVLGFASLTMSGTAEENVLLGAGAMNMQSGSQNVAIGYGSLGNLLNDRDNPNGGETSNNVAMGHLTAAVLQDGGKNVAIGIGSLHAATNVSGNVGVGSGTLHQGDDYLENTAIGAGVFNKDFSGSYNTGIGSHALLSMTTGEYNSGIGSYSLHGASANNYNSGIGYDAIRNIFEGHHYNSALGYQACNLNNISKHTCIGSSSNPVSSTDTTESIILGTTSLGAIKSYSQTIQPYSDKRLKNVKDEYKSGLAQIKEIKPMFFSFKSDKNKQKKLGVIAQEVQKVLPEAIEEDGNGYLTVRQGYINYALVNAVKELDKFVQNLISGVKSLIAKVFNLDKKVVAVEKDTDSIDADIQKINERLKELEADD